MNLIDKATTYDPNRKWSDDTIEQAAKLAMEELGFDTNIWTISETSFYEDTKLSADLKITDGKRVIWIGCRGRRAKFLEDYPVDVTYRFLNKRGYKTEFAKIMEGHGDFNFYYFVVNGKIVRWIIKDLSAFRKYHVEGEDGIYHPINGLTRDIKHNKQAGDNDFVVYNMYQIRQLDRHMDLDDTIIVAFSVGYFEDLIVEDKGLSFIGKSQQTIKMKDEYLRLDK